MKKEIRNAIGFLLGIPFIWIGYDHFIDPGIYDLIVPSYLGFPRFWTIISGVFEVTLGIGIIIPFFRRCAALLLSALLLVLYLANLNMWLNDIPFNGVKLSQNTHIIRLMIQLVLIVICLWLAEMNWWNIFRKKKVQ